MYFQNITAMAPAAPAIIASTSTAAASPSPSSPRKGTPNTTAVVLAVVIVAAIFFSIGFYLCCNGRRRREPVPATEDRSEDSLDDIEMQRFPRPETRQEIGGVQVLEAAPTREAAIANADRRAGQARSEQSRQVVEPQQRATQPLQYIGGIPVLPAAPTREAAINSPVRAPVRRLAISSAVCVRADDDFSPVSLSSPNTVIEAPISYSTNDDFSDVPLNSPATVVEVPVTYRTDNMPQVVSNYQCPSVRTASNTTYGSGHPESHNCHLLPVEPDSPDSVIRDPEAYNVDNEPPRFP